MLEYLKFAALYIGSTIEVEYAHRNEAHRAVLSGVIANNVQFEPLNNSGKYGLTSEICPLFLRPLSDISDEEVIEIASVVFTHNDVSIRYMIDEGKNLINKMCSMKLNNTGYIGYICLNIFDLLRSKSFLLPWMGLSPEEIIARGWAKYKTE